MDNYTEEKIDVLIRNNDTGEVVLYEDDGYFDEYGSFHDFIWSEGNYSCDCNRALFFFRSKNMLDPENNDCGEKLYSIRITKKSTCEVLYDEFDGKHFNVWIGADDVMNNLYTKKQPTLQELIAIKPRLCWVWDKNEEKREIAAVKDMEDGRYKAIGWLCWDNAKMLTDDEINKFLSDGE